LKTLGNQSRLFLLTLIVYLACCAPAHGQTSAFTYQGKLTDGGSPANGNYDLQFTLWDALAGGTQQPQPAPVTVTRSSVAVANGVFTAQLDFGVSTFSGADRFLEISVRPAGGLAFTTLAPRQQISSTPYAIRTLSATTADGLSGACVSCVQNSQINSVAGSKVSGTIPVAGVPGGSANYIQNTTTQQAGSNFNISGNGFMGGNMGIGTTAPQARLDVQSTAVGVDAISSTSSSGDGVVATSSIATGVLSSGGARGVWGVSSGGVGVLGQTGLSGVKGGIAIEAVGTSFFQGDTTPLSRSVVPGGTGVVIGSSTSPDIGYVFAYDYGAGVQRTLALNSPGGLVGINTTTPDTQLTVNGNVDKPGGGSWGTFSDERLKNIKGRFTPGLNAVMQLRPLRYEYKQDNALGIKSEGQHIGFSAQQVQRIIPEAVSKDDKGYLLINNDPILWTMLNAIKEQQVNIERQQSEIQQQRTRLKQQQNQIELMKKLICLDHPNADVCKAP
jgi:hypothetical protein